ncbi:MAG: hypothetical protein U1F43_30270 [Myxococcota bacterium]
MAQYGVEGVDALAVSDRDLALGLDELKKLAANGKVPFVATNLVQSDGKPVFTPWLAVDRAGLRVLVLALVGESAARMAKVSLEKEGLQFAPMVDAAKQAIAAQDKKPDLVVILSQLTPPEEMALNQAVPEARLFLGGDSMGMASETGAAGDGLSANGGQKGKYVGFVTVTFDDPGGAGAPLFDPNRRAGLQAKRDAADRRVQNYERLIASAKATTVAPPVPAPNAPNTPLVRQAPIEAYERQLAASRAELQLAESELASLPAEGAKTGNRVDLDLVPMDPKIEDEPVTKAAVDEFRKVWPDPTKPQPTPPVIAPGMSPTPPTPGTPPVPGH